MANGEALFRRQGELRREIDERQRELTQAPVGRQDQLRQQLEDARAALFEFENDNAEELATHYQSVRQELESARGPVQDPPGGELWARLEFLRNQADRDYQQWRATGDDAARQQWRSSSLVADRFLDRTTDARSGAYQQLREELSQSRVQSLTDDMARRQEARERAREQGLDNGRGLGR